jgi:hypothetical protein
MFVFHFCVKTVSVYFMSNYTDHYVKFTESESVSTVGLLQAVIAVELFIS